MQHRCWLRIGVIVLVVLILVACLNTPEPVPITVVVTTTPQPPQIIEPDQTFEEYFEGLTIIICIGQEPDWLLGTFSGMAATKQVLGAVDGHIFIGNPSDYQSLMLAELPSVENGDITFVDEDINTVMTVTYRFRNDIRWSDGVPFTVDDLIFSQNYYLNPDAHVLMPDILSQLKFEKIDDFTLKVTYPPGFVDPTYLLAAMSADEGLLTVLPKHVLKDVAPEDIFDTDYAHLPNPTLGPYEFVEWVEGDHISLRDTDNWWGGEIKTPNLIFRFIPDGDAALAATISGECYYATPDTNVTHQLDLIQNIPGRVSYEVVPSEYWLSFLVNSYPVADANGVTGIPFFADVRVRQAIAYGTNRQKIAEELGSAAPGLLNSFITPDEWNYNSELNEFYPFDPERAKALLQEAGWSDKDGDGVREYYGDGGTYSCERGTWNIPQGTAFDANIRYFFYDSGNPQYYPLSTALFQQNMADIGLKINPYFADPYSLGDSPIYLDVFGFGQLFIIRQPIGEGNELPLEKYAGINIYSWSPALLPDLEPGASGTYLTADKILAQRPDLLEGTSISTEMFYFGRPIPLEQMPPDPARLEFPQPSLPAGLTLVYANQAVKRGKVDYALNFSRWCNPDATQALFDAEHEREIEKRKQLYAEAQRLYMEDLPELPLFQWMDVAIYNPQLCGLSHTSAEPATWNVETWYIDPDGKCDG